MKLGFFPKKTLFLVFFLLIIIFFLVFLPKKSSIIIPSPIPEATPFLSPTVFPKGDVDVLERQENLRKNQYPLLDFTPYQTKDFLITYIGPLSLKILIFGKDKETSQKEALLWIKSKGVDPQTHKIKWEGL